MIARAVLGAVATGMLLLGAPEIGRAQQRPWDLGVTAGQVWFSAVATGNGTSLGPSPGLVVGMEVRRHVGTWAVGVGFDTRPSVLRAVDHGTAVEIAGASMARTGLLLALARPIGRRPASSVLLEGRLRADAWRLPGATSRMRLAPEIVLGLHYRAGGITVGHRIALGRSASPFRSEDLPAGYRTCALTWLALGVELSGRW